MLTCLLRELNLILMWETIWPVPGEVWFLCRVISASYSGYCVVLCFTLTSLLFTLDCAPALTGSPFLFLGPYTFWLLGHLVHVTPLSLRPRKTLLVARVGHMGHIKAMWCGINVGKREVSGLKWAYFTPQFLHWLAPWPFLITQNFLYSSFIKMTYPDVIFLYILLNDS